MLLLIGFAFPARGQDRPLIRRYQAARFEVLVQQLIEDRGWRAPVAPPSPLSMPLMDSLRVLLGPGGEREIEGGEEKQTFPIHTLHVIRRPERAWFKRHFADANWAYLGQVGLTPLDTTLTRVLRAGLEAHFGPPSLTLAEVVEQPDTPTGDVSQFEYWFVVNDSIPVKVMNTGTPFGRGVILAASARQRGRLEALRRALLGRLVQSKKRAPYVDYYYHARTGRWYRTGFDGDEYFLKPIPRSAVIPGRRPHLNGPA